MNRDAKSRTDASYRVAIVGAGTLKGKELADVLPDTSFPAVDIKLFDEDALLGHLEPVGDEVTFVQRATRENLEGVDFAVVPTAGPRSGPSAGSGGSGVIPPHDRGGAQR